MNAIEIKNVSYSYGEKKVLKGIDLTIGNSQMFCLLGPNGSGKSTLLRLLSTLDRPQLGSLTILGYDAHSNARLLRAKMGVVFQNPALDMKLTVLENLMHHGHLYRITGTALKRRCEELLGFFSLTDRKNDIAEKLSGGLKRRVEIAKCLIHKPLLLILDEPTNGLDPLVRKQVWEDLRRRQQIEQTTTVFTSHLLEEADAADHVALLDQGQLVAEGRPTDLKAALGKETLSIKCGNPQETAKQIEEKWGIKSLVTANEIRIQGTLLRELLPKLFEEFRDQLDSLTIGRPSLEDLFILKTGRTFDPGIANA